MSDSSCPGDSSNCQYHFHVEDPRYLSEHGGAHLEEDSEQGKSSTSNTPGVSQTPQEAQHAQQPIDKNDVGFRRIIRNFTPSYAVAPLSLCNGSQS